MTVSSSFHPPARRLPRWLRRNLRGKRASSALLAAVTISGLVAMSCTSTSETKAQAERAPVPVRVTQVGKGDLAVTLAYSGELKSVDSVEVLPVATGRVEDLMVDEGALVSAGQPLARLETDALAAQVKQALAGVASAQARLDGVLQGARPQEIAAAQASLEAARQRYQNMINGSRPEELSAAGAQLASARAKLADLEAGSKAADIAAAQAAADTAAANLARDEAKLRILVNPTQLDLDNAQSALDSADTAIRSAEAKLTQLRNPTQLDIDSAVSAVDSADATLRGAQAKLDDLKAMPKPADKAAAQATVAKAESDLRVVEQAYAKLIAPLNNEKLKKLLDAYQRLNVARERVADANRRGASADEIARLEVEVRQALELLQKAEEDTGTFVIGVRAEDVVAMRAQLDSASSALQSAQEKLAQTLQGATAADLQQAQASLDKARSDRDAARIKLDRLKNPTDADIQAAQAAVDKAQADREAAALKLERLKSPTDADVQTARASVDGSRATLDSTTAKLNQVKAGATQADIEAARASIAQTESAMAKLQKPFTDAELAVQAALVQQSQSQTEQVVKKFTKPDIDAAAAGVAQAEAAVELAQINLNRATITAPFDAVVVKKNVSKGAIVGAQTSLLSLVSQDTQVVFNVEEGSIGRLREGQRVGFTVAAFGERRFDGSIVSIAPTADAASRTFRVRANISNGVGVRAGMFANVLVTVQERKQVATVPTDALVPQGQDNFVLVVNGDKAERRKVQVGLRNETAVEILEGVKEGEQVVTRGNRTPLRPDDKVVVVQ